MNYDNFDYNKNNSEQQSASDNQLKPHEYRPYYQSYFYGATPTPPEPPQGENGVGKKKRGKKAAYVASLLAVAVISGMAGGGVTYQLISANEASDAALEISSEESIVPASANVSNTLTTQSSDIAAIAAKASASVVEISVEATAFYPFFGEATSSSSGSGVVLTEDGYIVTNNHVIDGADTITIRTVEGDEYDAVLIGTDEKTDLSVLKVDAQGLTPVTFADSDNVQVGEPAVAIGNSLGTLGGTVTDGIVSAKDREITIGDETMTLMQTSAAVNPGNSGGGLFDSQGNLIGVVNAKSTGTEVEGLGFAIPSNLVKEVTDDIIENGYVTGRVELGVSLLEISDEQSARMNRLSELGVYVAAVSKDNGLQAGDRIVSVDGNEIDSYEDVREILDNSSVGDILRFVVVRGGEETVVEVPVTEQVPDYIQQRVAQSSSI